VTNAQSAWLIVPQALLLLVIVTTWIKHRFEDWTSRLRYDCTSHLPDLRLRLDTTQQGQQRLLSRIDDLRSQK
jgi:hypothetical protein